MPILEVTQITREALLAAAAVFTTRDEPRHAEVCLSMAGKVGNLSPKAQKYAIDLLAMSASAPKPAARNSYPNIAALFFRANPLASLDFGDLSFHLKNDGSCCWIKINDKIAGVIERDAMRLFPSKVTAEEMDIVKMKLPAIEADPKAAAVLYGRATGRCCVCSRMLTDPKSIEAGIGPVCAGRMS